MVCPKKEAQIETLPLPAPVFPDLAKARFNDKTERFVTDNKRETYKSAL